MFIYGEEMSLSKSQIKYLRGLAQRLSPVVMLGKDGASEGVLKELKRALDDHELVKVKIQEEEREDYIAFSEQLAKDTGAELVQKIGRMAVYYVMNPNPDKRKIKLPKA
jgi:RNA-binding protein